MPSSSISSKSLEIPKTKRFPHEIMKSALRTPISSEKSSTTTDSLQSETRGTVYFPGCRKETNCNCEICIASINATLDLIPRSIHGNSRTTLSNPKRKFPRSPVSFTAPPDLLSPKSTSRNRPTNAASPPSDSTGTSNSEEKLQRPNHGLNTRAFLARFVFGLILVCGLDYGFSSRISRVLKPQLSPNLVHNLSEKSWKFEGLNAKFVFLENELNAAIVGDKVSSCSSDDSLWKINQDGLLLNSRCVLFKSMAEEVSIWGWPLQTAGMLASQGSSTSFSIITGNVAEWVSRDANYLSRKGNGSWMQGKWSCSIVQMDPNTWILEYRRSVLLEHTGLVSGVLEFLKMILTREFRRVVQGFWLPEIRHPDFIHRGSIPTPT